MTKGELIEKLKDIPNDVHIILRDNMYNIYYFKDDETYKKYKFDDNKYIIPIV